MTRAVRVQVLVRIVSARRRDHARTADRAIHQQGDTRGILAECLEDIVGAGAHLVIVIGGDVCRE